MKILIKPRVLIIEDDTAWQNILEEILSSMNLSVDIADSYESAKRKIRENTHHLVLVDLSLHADNHRNKDGLKVLDAVRQYDPNALTILLTGHATVELAVKAMNEHNALTCLRKESFQRSEFRKLIQSNVLVNYLPRTSIIDSNKN